MRIILVKSENIDDWFTIEKREHDGKEWFEETAPNCFSFRHSGRISDADVEGTAAEMLAIAKAIKNKDHTEFRRCAVAFVPIINKLHFHSPRNSQKYAVISIEEAEELADQILKELGPK